jgi:hypothetical protein
MRNKTNVTASPSKEKKSAKKKESNPNADKTPAKRAGSVNEIDEADERTRTAAIGYAM